MFRAAGCIIISIQKKFVFGALIAGLSLVIFFLPPKRSPVKPADGKARIREATVVKTVIVKTEPLDESLVTTGTIRAAESVEVQAEIAGKLLKINFEEGKLVRAGELLALIDDAELRASLQRGVYRRELGRIKAKRITTLADKGGVPQQEYDIATNELNVLDAEVALIEAQLKRTEVRAPFEGVIGLRNVSEGAYVTPGMLIARLQAIEEVKIDLTLPEKYSGKVRVGQLIDFSVAGTNATSTAEIYALEPQIDEITRTMLARARALNPSGIFRPGAFARVTWRAAQQADAVMLPSVAVISGSGGKSVFVAGKGVARKIIVTTGIRTAETIQILTGLQLGERVIVSGLQSLRDGSPIEFAEVGL